MTTAIFPSLLREDPRYYQMGKGASLTAPITPSIVFLSLERIQDIIDLASQNRVAMPQPPQSPTFTTFVFLLLYDGMNNELKEFWPDIRRKVFHKNRP